jgi:glyoxalase family protein
MGHGCQSAPSDPLVTSGDGSGIQKKLDRLGRMFQKNDDFAPMQVTLVTTAGPERKMSGIHHVTAIAGDALRNFDFYTRTLGLRFVKKTVNFDDPGTYHFYYGDEVGHPGTILTFFPWEHAEPGRRGVGHTHQTSFRVPAASLGYWTHRLIEKGAAHDASEKRFGETALPFRDPDGMSLAFVGVTGAEKEVGWSNGDVPAEHAIRGFHGVTLLIEEATKTSAILTDVFGFKVTAREGCTIRLNAPDNTTGGVVDIHEGREFLQGYQGRGSVHHIAFRASDDVEQAEMAHKLVARHGIHPTEQKDRNYFRSVYFREPGGILFEIATDIPGFAVDEPVMSLGEDLKLPAFLEPHRKDIENVLPPLEMAAQ